MAVSHPLSGVVHGNLDANPLIKCEINGVFNLSVLWWNPISREDLKGHSMKVKRVVGG